MAAVRDTSDSAILRRFADLADVKLNATLSKSIDAHYRIAEELIPFFSAERAKAEFDLEAARRAPGGIEKAYRFAAAAKTPEDFVPGENPIDGAVKNLEDARRVEADFKKAQRVASDYVGEMAREPAARMITKMQKVWASKIAFTLDPAKTTVADAAAAEGLAEILVRNMASVAIIVEDPRNKREATLLRQAYEAKPGCLPRLKDIRDRLDTEDKARRDGEAVAVAKAAQARAQMSGSAVSTGRMNLTDTEKESLAATARRRSGHVEEVVETDTVEVAV